MLTYDYTNLLADSIDELNGVSVAEIEGLQDRAAKVHDDLTKGRRNGEIGFYDLAYNDSVVEEINRVAAEVRERFDNFVLIGIGGSALGAIALHTSLKGMYSNLLEKSQRGKCPRMFFPDNIDPEYFGDLLKLIDLKKTCFNVVTKSGGTAETIACFSIVYDLIRKELGESAVKEHIIATTDPEKGLLRKVAKSHNLRTFDIPPNVGGRFSVLSPVGLLPAAVDGIDIGELLAGARDMDKRTESPDLFSNPAYLNSAFHYLLDSKKGKSISVMMPYSNALKDLADWYRQIWAESLGKRLSRDGKTEVFAGQTPVKALGATDQHSQIQLYVEGPNDKVITLVEVEKFRTQTQIPVIGGDFAEADYLGNHDLADLLKNELIATEATLTNNQRPNCTITFDEISPYNVGQFLFMYEVQTAFSGGMYGINPFDQPGVEEGKVSTYALMGRPGFEDKKPNVASKRCAL